MCTRPPPSMLACQPDDTCSASIALRSQNLRPIDLIFISTRWHLSTQQPQRARSVLEQFLTCCFPCRFPCRPCSCPCRCRCPCQRQSIARRFMDLPGANHQSHLARRMIDLCSAHAPRSHPLVASRIGRSHLSLSHLSLASIACIYRSHLLLTWHAPRHRSRIHISQPGLLVSRSSAFRLHIWRL